MSRVIKFDYGGATISLTEPLAKHRTLAKYWRGNLVSGWEAEFKDTSENIPDHEWALIFEYTQLVGAIVGVEGDLDFPLPYGDELGQSNAYLLMCKFWDNAPSDFLDAHEKALQGFTATDPND